MGKETGAWHVGEAARGEIDQQRNLEPLDP